MMPFKTLLSLFPINGRNGKTKGLSESIRACSDEGVSMMNRVPIGYLFFLSVTIFGCGGRTAPPPVGKAEEIEAKEEIDGKNRFFCQKPITEPAQVWPRVEAVRKLSERELLEKCGLDFVISLSEWRSPPVDLLKKIVTAEVLDFSALSDWIKTNAERAPRAVEAVVAMDILTGYELGKGTDVLMQNCQRWQALARDVPVVDEVLKEAAMVSELLPKIADVHLQRCRLEVNPLGFAVSCTPIHPPREKIDLNWKSESRDGLILNLELVRCQGSASCKELKKASREFLLLYLKTVNKTEKLKNDIFRDQLREWLKLPPFTTGPA
jgi:hypothetical protein